MGNVITGCFEARVWYFGVQQQNKARMHNILKSLFRLISLRRNLYSFKVLKVAIIVNFEFSFHKWISFHKWKKFPDNIRGAADWRMIESYILTLLVDLHSTKRDYRIIALQKQRPWARCGYKCAMQRDASEEKLDQTRRGRRVLAQAPAHLLSTIWILPAHSTYPTTEFSNMSSLTLSFTNIWILNYQLATLL